MYRVDDDDPLIIVLAMMAASNGTVATLPDLLQQKATETIELHRTVLREQSIVISKELIIAVAGQIQSTKLGWMRYAGCFVAGMIFAALITPGIRHLLSGV
jgi:hypothetical protein